MSSSTPNRTTRSNSGSPAINSPRGTQQSAEPSYSSVASTSSSNKKAPANYANAVLSSPSAAHESLKRDAVDNSPKHPNKGKSAKKVEDKGPSAQSKDNGSNNNTTSNGSSVQWPKIDPNSQLAKILHERTVWVATNLIGKIVEVQLKNGEVWEGVLHAPVIKPKAGKTGGNDTSTHSLGLQLRMAHRRDPNENPAGGMSNNNLRKSNVYSSKPVESFTIESGDVVMYMARDVSLDFSRGEGFATDTDISGHHSLRERKLQPWIPEGGGDLGGIGGIEDEGLDGHRPVDWDQFKANEEKFGVETTWDERYYTTPLDRNSKEYKTRAAEAERLAREIEGRTASNPHLAEERGVFVETEDYDEEARYGAVIRDNKPSTVAAEGSRQPLSSSGKYVPPGRRQAMGSAADEGANKDKAKSKQPGAKDAAPSKGSPALSNTSAPKKDEKSSSPSSQHPAVPPLGLDKLQQQQQQGEADSLSSNRSNSARGSPGLPGSPGSPRSPRSPLSPTSKTSEVKERLRLRLAVVNERLKNSAPIPTQGPNEKQDFPETPHRSPLLSPLVGDAKAINALSLEPSTPNIPADIVADFFQFSLSQKKDKESAEAISLREKKIAELKNFSANITKKIPAKATASPSAISVDALGGKEAAASNNNAATSPTGTTPARKDSLSSGSTAPATGTATKETSPSKEASKDKDKTPAASTATAGKDKEKDAAKEKEGSTMKSKLNPNAKVFKPMSANAPSFTPTGPAPPVPSVQPAGIPAHMMGGGDFPVYPGPRGFDEGYAGAYFQPPMPVGMPGRGQPNPMYPHPPNVAVPGMPHAYPGSPGQPMGIPGPGGMYPVRMVPGGPVGYQPYGPNPNFPYGPQAVMYGSSPGGAGQQAAATSPPSTPQQSATTAPATTQSPNHQGKRFGGNSNPSASPNVGSPSTSSPQQLYPPSPSAFPPQPMQPRGPMVVPQHGFYPMAQYPGGPVPVGLHPGGPVGVMEGGYPHGRGPYEYGGGGYPHSPSVGNAPHQQQHMGEDNKGDDSNTTPSGSNRIKFHVPNTDSIPSSDKK